jgi:HEAT repeat protein
VLADLLGAIGSVGGPGAFEALLPFLSHPNHLCQCAAGALGELDDPRAVQPLAYVVADKSKFWVPRSAAAGALGELAVHARCAARFVRSA